MVPLQRPNPDELLRQLQEQEARTRRGRLKIFFGYAPRVGKSVRMFDEGRRRASRGQDVVIGALQEKGIEEVREFISGLELIPLKAVDGGEVLDTDAILKRRPQACLIDELAYDNPPGNPRAHRWQDVEVLVEAGITVVSTLNLQYVAEQQDSVERITGRRTTCAVPEAFVHSADEIVLVDVPANGIAEEGERTSRLAEEQLSALRELALLVTAQVVEDQLIRYMERHDIHKSWGTQERILVCVTPRSHAREMLETAARVASRFHAQLAALYVRQGEISRGEEELVEERLEYARKVGAEVHLLDSKGDAIQQIVEFARTNRFTQLFIGHTQRSGWKFWEKNPVDRLIEAAEGMDVRIFPHSRSA